MIQVAFMCQVGLQVNTLSTGHISTQGLHTCCVQVPSQASQTATVVGRGGPLQWWGSMDRRNTPLKGGTQNRTKEADTSGFML